MKTELEYMLTKFRSSFDVCWTAVLDEIGSTQAQLTIGNRLRPQLALLGYLAGAEPSKWASDDFMSIADVAVSIELIHKASLILDDWIDGDDQRHGLPAFHAEFSPEYGVMLAIKLVGLSAYRMHGVFEQNAVLPHHYDLCLNTVIETIYAMASGACKELALEGEDIFDYDVVREISRLQTSEIIGNSLLLGYYAGTANYTNYGIISGLKQLGDKCGYIFQAMNDMEAFTNPEKLLQHKGHINFDRSGSRKNLMIALLYQTARKRDKERIKYADGNELVKMAQKYNIAEYYLRELDMEYKSMLTDVAGLSSEGVSEEWRNMICSFLSEVKTAAESRL